MLLTYQTLKEESIPMFLKLFQKVKRREFVQTYVMRSVLNWYQNQIRMPQEKKEYRPKSLMYIDAKIHNKY